MIGLVLQTDRLLFKNRRAIVQKLKEQKRRQVQNYRRKSQRPISSRNTTLTISHENNWEESQEPVSNSLIPKIGKTNKTTPKSSRNLKDSAKSRNKRMKTMSSQRTKNVPMPSSSQRNRLAPMNSILERRTSIKTSPFSGRSMVSRRRCHAYILWMPKYVQRTPIMFSKWSSMFFRVNHNWWKVSNWKTKGFPLFRAWRNSSAKKRNIRRKT